MTCPKCGSPRPAGATECPDCGVIYARHEALAAKKRAAEAEERRRAAIAEMYEADAKKAAPAEPPQPKRRGLVVCPACFKRVSGNAESCPHCGEPIRENPNLAPVGGSLGFQLAMLGVFAFAAGLAYLLWWGGHESPSAKFEAERPATITIGDAVVGCRDVEDFRALADIAASHDYEGYSRLLQAHVAAQTCKRLPPGARAYREGYSNQHGADKIRLEGESGHWWINAQ